MNTSRGKVRLAAMESPEVWFEEKLSGKLEKGQAEIKLDPIFIEVTTINDQFPMRVIATPNEECNGLWVEKFNDKIIVHELKNGNSDATFDISISALRKDLEGRRFDIVNEKPKGESFIQSYAVIRKKDTDMSEKDKTSLIFLCLWAIAIFIFYIYYSIRTSFFTPYFGEVLPALVLILAYGIVFFAAEMKSGEKHRKNVGWVCILIIATLYISSISYVNTPFDCVWSPETVDDISQYMELHTDEGDVVMSGAMIWTLETNTKPFMNITHPLGCLRKMSDDKIKEVEYQMEHGKPKFIVLDGYTEKTYLRHVTKIYDIMNESYVLKKEVYGSRYPVKIYDLNQ